MPFCKANIAFGGIFQRKMIRRKIVRQMRLYKKSNLPEYEFLTNWIISQQIDKKLYPIKSMRSGT